MEQLNDMKHKELRHVTSYISPYTINYIHEKNPWIMAWWSAAFPGLGHLMLCKYLVAFTLFFWEISVNYLAGINLAIYYSMIGEMDQASSAINKQWFLMYICVYVFAIWDSYSKTVLLNKRYILSYKKGYDIISPNISALELNILVKRQPLQSIIWSFLAPGLGHIYINRIFTSLVFIILFVVTSYFSNLLPAIHYSLEGNFMAAKSCINIQWFLYMPSLYSFVAYDAYVNTVEYNKIYEREQKKYFHREYQNKDFDYPI
ncbi:hypothetical protein ACERII_09195 [Evansella sp. AB-rgal1]|uniref:hypothetical protein n=1 Tax=Evansella sp. AB-rgal1 TaxID=3242696 RepID=UPI00359D8554